MSDNFGNTRTKVAQFFYRRLQKNVKQNKVNDFKFDSIKSIGIIFDGDSKKINSLINSLSTEFKSKSGVVSIYLLAYNVDDVHKPDSIGVPTVFFTDKDLNWYGKPKFKDVDNFIETPFDLLINLASNDTWAIKFSTLLSRAKFKVGKLEDNSDVYDFMVDNSNNLSTDNLHKLILDYLKIINS
jgi:hypothetical protein